jgi:exopolysaccharide biosynthesis polyprenyl glycosylphosphotransferase
MLEQQRRGRRDRRDLLRQAPLWQPPQWHAPLWRFTCLRSFVLAVDVGALVTVDVIAGITWGTIDQRVSITSMASFSVLVVLLFRAFGLYTAGPRTHALDWIRQVVAAISIATLAMVALPVPDALSRPQAFRVWWLSTLLLITCRVLLKRWGLHRSRSLTEPTLIVGAGHVGRLLEKRLRAQHGLGLNPIGFLDDDPLIEGTGSFLPVLGGCDDLDRIVAEHGVRHVIVTFSTASHQRLLGVIRRCGALNISVSVVPRLFEIVTEQTSIQHVGALPLVSIRPSSPRGLRISVKYSLDRIGAAALLIVLAPLFAVLAVAVWVSLGRPIFFRQVRVGRDGHRFEMLKFRSMTDVDTADMGAELRPSADALVEDSERCTRVGGFLRRMSLDELPQLINILRGDMSFIGPRPERPDLVSDFRDRIYRYDDRHRVKSGITGWTQIHGIGRGEQRFSHETLSDRVEWDNFYIENWSPWLDLKILLRTPAAVWRFRQSSNGTTHPTEPFEAALTARRPRGSTSEHALQTVMESQGSASQPSRIHIDE